MFTYFETTNAQERDVIAENIKNLYFCWLEATNDTWLDLRMAKTEAEYRDAQNMHAEAIGRLGAAQAILHELGICFAGLPEYGGEEL